MRYQGFVVGVAQLGRGRIEQALGDIVKQINHFEAVFPQEGRRDLRVRFANMSPQLDDLRFFHRWNGKGVAGLDHV